MTGSNTKLYPPLHKRLYSVWYRHVRVYAKYLLSNALPPFLEPLIFLAAIGLGLGKYITKSMEGMRYIEYLGTGLLATTAMFTAAYECSFGTFIRLERQKVYNGMLAAPITANNLVVGEIIWAGTKGFFYAFSVAVVLVAFGIVHLPYCLGAPLVGFATGVMFGALSLLVTSFVKTINHFSFYFTGFISPMFFFSGVFFPVSSLPRFLQPVVELIPLTHSVRLVRAVCTNNYRPQLAADLLYVVVFMVVVSFFAAKRLRTRLVN